jgi:hypothetical protein
LNVRVPPGEARAAGLDRSGVSRNDALLAIVPALRRAARATGPLTPDELEAFDERDFARGRRILEPAAGMVQGIDASGALVVLTTAGLVKLQAGSLVLSGEQ